MSEVISCVVWYCTDVKAPGKHTCDGVEGIERRGAHEVNRYVREDGHRGSDEDSARYGDGPIPAV